MLEALALSWLWNLAVIAIVMIAWRITEAVSRAPILDLILALLTWIPWIIAVQRYGWWGLPGVVLGQFLSLQTFCILHSAAHPRPKGSIRRSLDRYVGPARNHLGLWLTIPALPIFLMIRLGEAVLYPTLVWTLGFPRYRIADWVNVSRQKFEGLIGHDLVWCLYCDWMTGVYSLGAEMLRNVESFWCPIRFYEGKKCENCRLDFPDIDKWVDAKGTMKDVEKALDDHYQKTKAGERSWWGHPQRRTRR